jgi:archaellum biogenesis ATPase FlaH
VQLVTPRNTGETTTKITRVYDLPSVWDIQAEFEWLVEGAVSVGSVNLLSGESGTGKSWVSIDLAGSVASGRPFAGLTVHRRPVLYVDGENPPAVVKERLRDLGIKPHQDFYIWGGWNDDPPPGPDDPRVMEFAREQKALLIWDSFVEFNPGDEMSATDTRQFMKKFRALANEGATVLILHHTGKATTSQDYRGSSDIKAGVDTAYRLESEERREGKIHRLKMVNFKSRAAAGRDFRLEFAPGEGFRGIGFAGAAPKPEEQLRSILQEFGEMNGTQLKKVAEERHGISKHKCDKFLGEWPNQWKGGKGNERRYSWGPILKAA